jgi:hypothetical protein
MRGPDDADTGEENDEYDDDACQDRIHAVSLWFGFYELL